RVSQPATVAPLLDNRIAADRTPRHLPPAPLLVRFFHFFQFSLRHVGGNVALWSAPEGTAEWPATLAGEQAIKRQEVEFSGPGQFATFVRERGNPHVDVIPQPLDPQSDLPLGLDQPSTQPLAAAGAPRGAFPGAHGGTGRDPRVPAAPVRN